MSAAAAGRTIGANPGEPTSTAPAPVAAGERLAALDTLRGVAVLGILVMNVYAFAMPIKAYYNPLSMGGTEALNIGTWFLTHVLFDQKFLSIFAMLFGAGIVLMSARADSRGGSLTPVYYRRMFWLVVAGALHAYLIWFGDILFTYAVIGMLVYPLRRLEPRKLISIALLLLPVALLLSYGNSHYIERTIEEVAEIAAKQAAGESLTGEQQETLEEWQSSRALFAPTAEDLRKDVETYRGGYFEIVAFRTPMVAMMQVAGIPFFGIWRIGGLMLIGMALMKMRVLSGERSAEFYRRMMLAGYGLGLPLTGFSGLNLYVHEFDMVYAFRYGNIANYFGSIIVALGHVGLVMLVVRSGLAIRLMARFAAVGRMALTNYLMHSVILTTVFYGYGYGLYGRVPRLPQMAFVAAVIALQLVVSPWWLARYRFGPVEWLWRSLTYRQRQPMRVPRPV